MALLEDIWWVPQGVVDEMGERIPSGVLEYSRAVVLPVKGSSPEDGGLVVTRSLELWIRPAPEWSAEAEEQGGGASVALRGLDWEVEGVGWYKGKALQLIVGRAEG